MTQQNTCNFPNCAIVEQLEAVALKNAKSLEVVTLKNAEIAEAAVHYVNLVVGGAPVTEAGSAFQAMFLAIMRNDVVARQKTEVPHL